MEDEDYNQNEGLKQAYRTAYLVAGFIRDTLTTAEKNELDDWIKASDDNMRLFDELTDEKNLKQSLEWYDGMDTETALQQSKEKIRFAGKRVRLWPYSVAASLLLAVGILFYFKPWSKSSTSPPLVTQSNDISPAEGKATLTLENGAVVTIGSKDTIINGQIKITQDKSEIMYSQQASSASLVYHTLTVPRKGHYKLLLPDGTIVWLNAESSIRYPVAFGDNERKVYVTGETYFEVAKDKARPFRVISDDVSIEVLGTKFNVNAYSNEPYTAATLVEGSILVTKGSNENILKPGQQAQLSATGFNIAAVETKDIIAWKNNQFRFINTPLEAIMRQVERWYDAEIVYEDKPADHFNAEISRDEPLSKLLRKLELTKRVHFKIENNKVIVMK
ncbi:MAG TPA: FecR domain-containing protein [Chitinophagaceae bacterium]|nr:FecR domain-containing protein [Chitinophagaceae bacterium]